MRFSIRDLLWLAVVAGLALAWGIDHSSMGRKDAINFLDSSWVVSDAYVLGKSDREPVGWWIVVVGGKIAFIDKASVEFFEIKSSDAATEERFDLVQNGRPVGKILAINSDGKMTLFINHELGGSRGVKDPVPDRLQCDETFVCLPIPTFEGRATERTHTGRGGGDAILEHNELTVMVWLCRARVEWTG